MVHLRDIPRTAVFAWYPRTGGALLVTGTRADTIDADFSDVTKLELWDLDLYHGSESQLNPIMSLNTNSRFYDVAWAAPDTEHPHGVIAGALENGNLELYDAGKLMRGASDALLERPSKHKGAMKTLQFNPLKPKILAAAGVGGEIFIYNMDDIQTPFRLVLSRDDIETLAWNMKVPHILAVGGATGQVTVWDVKTKKTSLILNNNRKPVSAITWDPTNSTRLITASPDDNAPEIYVWNLRNSNVPEKTLSGHDQGVLSLSWCAQDSNILLSSGKDHRTLGWNPHTGRLLGELHRGTNWAFLTRFNPGNPNLTATSSFDGKISVQTMENTNNTSDDIISAQGNLDGEDFFASAHVAPQVASFSLPEPPEWYLKPVGATFGFGGKVVYFTTTETGHGPSTSSVVHITHFSADAELARAFHKFEEAMSSGNILSICVSHIENARTDNDKADWEVLRTLVSDNPRSKVLERLGFRIAEGGIRSYQEISTVGMALEEDGKKETDECKNRRSSLFGNKVGKYGEDVSNDSSVAKEEQTGSNSHSAGDTFRLFGQNNSAVEDMIMKEVILGNFSKAVDICLNEKRIADAFVIANCGGKELLLKVQTTYLQGSRGTHSYLRLLRSVVNKDLWDVARHADLTNWKEALAALCTFAEPTDFPSFCEVLGDRILEAGFRQDACLCFMVGSRLEKVVRIWISELDEAENVKEDYVGDSSFSVHTKSLQQFIEKVSVFRHVANLKDGEISKTSGWKLAPLYDKYIEYADVIAETGLITIAQRYLDLVPTAYAGAKTARSRAHSALQRNPTLLQQHTAAVIDPANTTRTSFISSNHLPVQQQPGTAGTSSDNPYVPAATAVVPSNLHTSATSVSSRNTYAPPFPYTSSSYGQPEQASSFTHPAASYPPPTSTVPSQNSAMSISPPPAKDVGSWNDVPLVTRQPVRRPTPSVAPITVPFGTQILSGPPTSNSHGPIGHQGASMLPPPPKDSASLRITSAPIGLPVGSTSFVRSQPPPSSSVNKYSMPPLSAVASSETAQNAVEPPQTESLFDATLIRPPSTSRYTPAPIIHQSPVSGVQSRSAPSPYDGVEHHSAQPLIQQPMSAPPMSVRSNVSGQPRTAFSTTAVPSSSLSTDISEVAMPPVLSKESYPPGDRSHIPPLAEQLVQILNAELVRITAKAPPAFTAQVKDTNKRINLLFDHLNNSELIKHETVVRLDELARALKVKAYDQAQRIQMEIHSNKPEECGNWMVGVKRLIAMSKATP